jgi:hypothetical protein
LLRHQWRRTCLTFYLFLKTPTSTPLGERVTTDEELDSW